MTTGNAKRTRHLVAVWNPALAENALDASVQMLLEAVRDFRDKKREEEDVYVWWGKVRSSNRQQPLPHLTDILALDDKLDVDHGPECEMHLYLTNYRALYVAHVGEITAENVLDTEPESVPAFYAAAKLNCDCWFQLRDIRFLVLAGVEER